jgi:hypothetical protein
MAVAEVISGAQQIERRTVVGACCDDHHWLLRRMHHDHRAIDGYQHVAAAHQRAAGQEHAERAALRIGRVEAAFLAHVPIELDARGALDEHGREAARLGDQLVDGEHGRWSGAAWPKVSQHLRNAQVRSFPSFGNENHC